MEQSGRTSGLRRIHAWIGIGLLATVIALFATQTVALAADPPNQPFDLIYRVEDVKYRIYQDGVGMLGRTEGTLTDAPLPGTSIVKAYLVWAGLGRDNDGILFQRVGNGASVRVMPDAGMTWNKDTFGANTWGCCGNELTVYAADVTDLGIVQVGTNSYTVADMSIEHLRGGQPFEENWGFSLLVVYEDPTLDRSRDIIIKLGNDGLFAGWTGLIGPNSDVQCFAFDSNGQARRANFSLVVGGVENETRFNALWGMADNAPYVDPTNEGGTWTQNQGLINLPPNIVGVPGSTQLDGPFPNDSVFPEPDFGPPFSDRNGDEWDEYQRFDVMIDATDTWVCVQVESATQANRPDLPPVGSGSTNRAASIGFLGFIALMENVTPDAPSIDIIKYTNGLDANDPNGSPVPVIAPGDPVTWTYVVTNTGTVIIPGSDITVTDNVIGTVSTIIDNGDGDADLAPGEVWTYQATGTAIDLRNPPTDSNLVLVTDVCTQDNTVTPPSTAYTNIGTVTIPTMSAEDPSSYCGPLPGPQIDIIKYTNGFDANDPNGPSVPVIAPNGAVTWTYAVTNVGEVDIPEADITVTDNVIGAVTAIIDKGTGDAVLSPNEVWVYQATGTALDLGNPPADDALVLVTDVCTQGNATTPPSTAYTNVGTVTIPTMSAADPSSYCGPQPEIDIIKYTNGFDANDPNGPLVPVITPGDPVTWTYAVTNVGVVSIPESDITVADNVIGAVTQIIDKSDGDAVMAPGETWMYQATGTALDLSSPPDDPNLRLVTDVCTQGTTTTRPSTAYTNIGSVAIPSMTASDPSSYCGPPPAALDETDEPAMNRIYIPLLNR
ncbi:MAG: hypothetical protein H6644_14285 [Caldilineaceae bacterium]|nr:hypothetical protein [Caldilineaceae bacterium]